MLNKKIFVSRLEKLEFLMRKYSMEKVVLDSINNLKVEIDEYATRILMIGEFSSGKSAFLNKLLEKEDLFKVDQAPETAIASEIIYDKKEFVECVDLKNDISKVNFEDAKNLNASNYKYLIYHVNSSYLQKIPEVILVDMPGLNSNIENHNKAIAQYINKGSGYILLVSCDNGTLRNETKQFIKEITHYNQGLTCFISKSDLKIPKEVNTVASEVELQINEIYNDKVEVRSISILDSYDEFETKATNAIKSFEPQKLFISRFAFEINKIIDLEKFTLENLMKAMALDVSDIDKEIYEAVRKKKKLEGKLTEELNNLDYKYKTEILYSIENDIKSALLNQSDNITDAILMSKDAFSSLINSIIRPVIVSSTQKHISQSFADLIEQLDISFKDVKFENYAPAIQNFLEDWKKQNNINTIKPIPRPVLRPEDKLKYMGVSSAIAIATSIVNPVIELIIVFLPTILEGLSYIYKQFMRDEIKEKVEKIVIPQIIDKLLPELRKVILEQKEIVAAKIREDFENAIYTEISALENAKRKKETYVENYDKEKNDKKCDLNKLNELYF